MDCGYTPLVSKHMYVLCLVHVPLQVDPIVNERKKLNVQIQAHLPQVCFVAQSDTSHTAKSPQHNCCSTPQLHLAHAACMHFGTSFSSVTP